MTIESPSSAEDWVKAVARAYADSDPGVTEIARAALKAIDGEKKQLDEARYLIQQIARRINPPATQTPSLVVSPSTVTVDDEDSESGSGGLSEEQRIQATAYIEEALLFGDGRSIEDIISDVIVRLGGERALRVRQPRAVIGTMVHHAQRRVLPKPTESESRNGETSKVAVGSGDIDPDDIPF